MNLTGIIVSGDADKKTIGILCNESLAGLTIGERVTLSVGDNKTEDYLLKETRVKEWNEHTD